MSYDLFESSLNLRRFGARNFVGPWVSYIKCSSDLLEQGCIIERFGQKVDCTGPQGLHPISHRRVQR